MEESLRDFPGETGEMQNVDQTCVQTCFTELKSHRYLQGESLLVVDEVITYSPYKYLYNPSYPCKRPVTGVITPFATGRVGAHLVRNQGFFSRERCPSEQLSDGLMFMSGNKDSVFNAQQLGTG